MNYLNRKKIFYIRVLRKSSSKEQARQFHSIGGQRGAFENFDNMSGATCLHEVVIKCSADKGANFKSEEFDEVWRKAKALRNKLTHVLWVNVDRYGRSGGAAMTWFEKFQNIGIEVNFIHQWFNFDVPESLREFYGRLGDAQAEIKRLSIRTCEGKAGLREYGYYNDQLPKCWAYEKDRRPDGRKYAEKIDPYFSAYKAATISFHEGSTQSQAIKKAQITTGYRIPSSTLSRFLMFPLAYGYVPIWNDYKIPVHSRIMIDMKPCENVPVMFNDINMYYKIRDRVISESNNGMGLSRDPFNPEFPLAVSCPNCLKKMRGYNANPSRKTPTPYYDCKECGNNTRVNRNKLDILITEMLNSIIINEGDESYAKKGANKAINEVGLNESKKREAISKKISDIKERIDYLDDNLHRYEPEVYNESRSKMKSQLIKAESDLQLLNEEKDAGLDIRSKVLKSVRNIGDWYKNAGPIQKAKLMNAFFPEGFTVSDNLVRTWQFNRILASMCSFPDYYIIKKGEQDVNLSHSPDCGRIRAESRTIKMHAILLRDFFSGVELAA